MTLNPLSWYNIVALRNTSFLHYMILMTAIPDSHFVYKKWYVQVLIQKPMNVVSLRNTDFAVFWGVPNSMTPVVRRRGEDAHTERIMLLCRRRQRIERSCSSQGTPRVAGSHQKQGRRKGGFFLRTFRGSMALLILDFQHLELWKSKFLL